MNTNASRRGFLAAIGLAAAGPALSAAPARVAGGTQRTIRLAVKYGMIGIEGSVKDKFRLLKDIGYDGVEMDSPSDLDRAEVIAASKAVGLPIHGVVDSVHWQVRLSDPDHAVRAQGLGHLVTAMSDAHAYGGDTVLLVPGAVRDEANENFGQAWERSQNEVRKVVPLAEKLNVRIAIEVVWNNFITTPEQLIEYVDAFDSPFVGAYFDCSNMIKYGVPPAEWIRRLGKRMVKFDLKGYSKARAAQAGDEWKGFCEIGEGEENWPEVCMALDEVGYDGWATAEVGGGGRERLADILARMTRAFAG